jgi:hypothetical protein
MRDINPTVEEDHRNNVTVEDNDMTTNNGVDNLDEMFLNVDGDFTGKGQSQIKVLTNDEGLRDTSIFGMYERTK